MILAFIFNKKHVEFRCFAETKTRMESEPNILAHVYVDKWTYVVKLQQYY